MKAEIYIGTFSSQDIIINEGDSLKIPIFFLGGDSVEKPIELFIWKEVGLNKEYFSSSGWKVFTDFSQITPVLSLDKMIEYANITWTGYENTKGLDSFTLYVCMDTVVDNKLQQGITVACGERKIIIKKNIPVPTPDPIPDPVCIPASAVITPASISRTFPVGGNAPNTTVTIKDNCLNKLSYKVISVTGSWITSPKIGDMGAGALTLVLNSSSLPMTIYNGGITVDTPYGIKTIPVMLNMVKVPGDTTLLKNGEIQYYSYDPGQIRYFSIYEVSNKGTGNTKSLVVDMMDMNQFALYNVDMIVKYAGVNGEYGKPTMSDYNDIKAGKIKFGQNNFWFHLTSIAFETVTIPAPNPQGYYYVMVINADTVRESRISINYWDMDSY